MTPWQKAEIVHAVRHTQGEYDSRELIAALEKVLLVDVEYQTLIAAGDSAERSGVR
jgi:hypothetical protein